MFEALVKSFLGDVLDDTGKTLLNELAQKAGTGNKPTWSHIDVAEAELVAALANGADDGA